MDCLCSSSNDSSSLCNSPQQLIQLIRHINNELYSEYKKTETEKKGATMYIIVMLCLFASIIVVVMVRAIRPMRTIDDQVTTLFNSMRIRVDVENDVLQRLKLKEAKLRAQRWLIEATRRGASRISLKRYRSSSSPDGGNQSMVSRTASIRRHHSATSSPGYLSARPSHFRSSNLSSSYPRAASYSGYLPEIVVTNAELFTTIDIIDNDDCSPVSRASSSVFSFDDEEEDVRIAGTGDV